jgi:four helix bundle protein
VTIALGSASEARDLIDLSIRLSLLNTDQFTEVDRQADLLIRGLQNMVSSLQVQHEDNS